MSFEYLSNSHAYIYCSGPPSSIEMVINDVYHISPKAYMAWRQVNDRNNLIMDLMNCGVHRWRSLLFPPASFSTFLAFIFCRLQHIRFS